MGPLSEGEDTGRQGGWNGPGSVGSGLERTVYIA